MRLCIIDYSSTTGITFTVPWKCLPFSPSRGVEGGERTRFCSRLVNNVDHIRGPTNPYNNLAPIRTRTHNHRCTRKMLANRGESVRKLVELQPLPVIKSKERRRYGRRAWLAAEYEKGGEGSYYTLTMFKRGCVSFDRARLISKFPISLHFSLSVDIDREKIRRALINGKRRNSNIGG